MKILVVDDYPLIVEDILDELKNIVPEAELMGTSESMDVARIFEKEHPEVIFMDIDMPGLNGLAIAKRILEIEPLTNIIYVTAYEKYALDSYRTYASDFIVKPITGQRLKEALDNLRHPVSNIPQEKVANMYSDSRALGRQIHRYRELQNMSRNEFARRMNVSIQTVYRWESGDRVPDVMTLMEIARTLRVTLDQITGLSE